MGMSAKNSEWLASGVVGKKMLTRSDAVDDSGVEQQRGTGAHADSDDEPDLIAFSPSPSVAAELPRVPGEAPNPAPAQVSTLTYTMLMHAAVARDYKTTSDIPGPRCAL